MNWLHYQNGELCAHQLYLSQLAVEVGTPCYVYSKPAMQSAIAEFQQAAKGRNVLICYALKANPNLAVVDLMAKEGAGFDIVSLGELKRVLAVGGDPKKVVFSGVGKSRYEIMEALKVGVGCFNVESISELKRLNECALSLGLRAPVSLRVNPDVDPKTHPYISTGLKQNKFGIAHAQALEAYRLADSLQGLHVLGIDCHIGSQITELAPFLDALEKVLQLMEAIDAAGIKLHHLDLGGGLGIDYQDGEGQPPSRASLFEALFKRIDSHPIAKHCQLMFEFGRSLVGNAGALLTRVEYIKPATPGVPDAKAFAIVDAAMNDLMRPALYQAYHHSLPVKQHSPAPTARYDIVGPVCESGDWLARDRDLALQEGDLMVLQSAGAYGMSMSSNYNSRARAAEVMVEGGRWWVVRQRETLDDLFALEKAGG